MPAAKKRTASPAQLRALARGRAKLKASRRRTAKPKRKTARKNNPAIHTEIGPYSEYPVAQERAMKIKSKGNAGNIRITKRSGKWWITYTERKHNPDPALMRKRALSSNLKAGTATTKARGRMTNPPHYVIKTAEGKGYFDGAGWTASKQGAAQYMSKAKATTIATKVANATKKSVYVEAV